jgi:hypothetical protein
MREHHQGLHFTEMRLKGLKIYKADPVPGENLSWSKVEYTEMLLTQHDLYAVVDKRADRISTARQYHSLSASLRMHNTSHTAPCITLNTDMGFVQKSTMCSRRPDFRRQLQRALSLSSFETDSQSTSKLSTGDTTEDQESVLSGSDRSNVHSDHVGHTHEDQIDLALFAAAPMEENSEEQTGLPGDRDMIALECVAE